MLLDRRSICSNRAAESRGEGAVCTKTKPKTAGPTQQPDEDVSSLRVLFVLKPSQNRGTYPATWRRCEFVEGAVCAKTKPKPWDLASNRALRVLVLARRSQSGGEEVKQTTFRQSCRCCGSSRGQRTR